jgi:hypothetical protein
MNNTLRRACTGVYVGNISEKVFTLCVNTTVPPYGSLICKKWFLSLLLLSLAPVTIAIAIAAVNAAVIAATDVNTVAAATGATAAIASAAVVAAPLQLFAVS